MPTDSSFPEAVEPAAKIVVYVCPSPDCGNYYASPNFRPDRSDIESNQTKFDQEHGGRTDTHPRIECPACRLRGRKSNRVPYVVTQYVELEAAVKRVRVDKENSES